MNPAYSVILFTTASGAGYGMLALLGLVGLQHGQSSSLAFGLTAMVVALALITIGLLSSTFHLGHPERAWRALSQWRSSWLSREGVAAVVTYPVALAFGLAWTGIVDAPNWISPLGIATAVMSALTVICTGMIYASLPTIRQWHQMLTVPVYLVLAAATGAVILAAVATLFARFQWFQAALATALLLIGLILKEIYWFTIDGSYNAATPFLPPPASRATFGNGRCRTPTSTSSRRRWGSWWSASTLGSCASSRHLALVLRPSR